MREFCAFVSIERHGAIEVIIKIVQLFSETLIPPVLVRLTAF